MSKFSDMGLIMNMIGMKRPREDNSDHQIDSITAMANYLMLFSGTDQLQVLSTAASNHHHHQYRDVSPSRVFECKTCNRQFPSFQALGGHRASHKKPKLAGDLSLQSSEASPPKPKTHECSICGQEFAVGQALGGHMRRHRAAAVSDSPAAPVISKNSSMEKRIWGLDLNLSPLENDVDLDFGLGKMASPLALNCVS